jgi:hypothetical protein
MLSSVRRPLPQIIPYVRSLSQSHKPDLEIPISKKLWQARKRARLANGAAITAQIILRQ